jgi:tetratricopeptide (TPR) repeat protein
MPTPGSPDRSRPRLPSPVYRDLKAASGAQLDAVATAYVEAGEALESGDVARAVTLLTDAKRRAARSAMVREALGIALYLDGRFKEAGRELAAYRRMSGRSDQNHLRADCARANGQLDRAEDLVDEMIAAKAPPDRVAEGLLVVAGARADRDDVDAALAALHRVDLEPRTVEPHHLRLWYLAAELERRRGDDDAAIGYLQAIATVDPAFLDVTDQLSELDGDGDAQSAPPVSSSASRLRQ